MSLHASEPGSSGGRAPDTANSNRVSDHLNRVARRLMLYPLVTIPIVILRLGTLAGWKPPPPYTLFAGIAFSFSGLANVFLFIATRHAFIRQAAEVRPHMHISIQQVTIMEVARGSQTIHLDELSSATQPGEQDGASEKIDLEEGGAFKLRERTPDAEGDVGAPNVIGVGVLTRE
ncbi:hypothetical protein FRC10_006029 [Ceratobasidium sp. 414]|nr:hypothetical protein FRC10_006029 [Ceratobasidium sp. 414]